MLRFSSLYASILSYFRFCVNTSRPLWIEVLRAIPHNWGHKGGCAVTSAFFIRYYGKKRDFCKQRRMKNAPLAPAVEWDGVGLKFSVHILAYWKGKIAVPEEQRFSSSSDSWKCTFVPKQMKLLYIPVLILHHLWAPTIIQVAVGWFGTKRLYMKRR